MTQKQEIALAISPILVVLMFIIFQGLAVLIGKDLAWYVGLFIYWVIFCIAVPMFLIGKNNILLKFKYRSTTFMNWLIVSIPILFTLIGVVFVLEKVDRSFIQALIWIGMGIGNGIFEEILWRGTYSDLFPDNIVFGWLWPSIWFAIWHFAPGSLSQNRPVSMLVGGALFFGLCWGWVSYKTKSILLTSVSHFLSGFVQLLG
jgi:membrane protease YdiL (CAAX protease family)